jgi:hypothetical protein
VRSYVKEKTKKEKETWKLVGMGGVEKVRWAKVHKTFGSVVVKLK